MYRYMHKTWHIIKSIAIYVMLVHITLLSFTQIKQIIYYMYV